MEIKALIQGEQKILKLTITDNVTKEAVNLTGCTFAFRMKPKTTGTNIDKEDADFDKSEVLDGIVKVTLLTTDLAVVKSYDCQLKITFPNDEIDKSRIFTINVVSPIL